MRVLIAEDDKTSQHTLKTILTKWGYEPVIAGDGNEAWEILKSRDAPNIVIMDWMMPGMNGIDLCRKLRQLNSPNYTYIILLTAKSDTEDIVTAIYAGADDYITKPYDVRELRVHLLAAQRLLNLQTELLDANKSLKASQKTLAAFNQSLESQVAERTEEVEQLLRQKDKFVNQLGHDLKTPLTPLVALLPLALKMVDNPKVKELLQVSVDNVAYMRTLVEETLHIARLRSPSLELNLQTVNLLTETRNLIAAHRHVLDEKPITVINTITDSVYVQADLLRLKEVFNNLLSNAVKYTASRGTLTIKAHREDDIITISVADAGIGLTKAQESRIFEEFYKADESRHDRSSSGLGLCICKSIIEKHGGKIWAQSDGPGRGTTICFTLRAACDSRKIDNSNEIATFKKREKKNV